MLRRIEDRPDYRLQVLCPAEALADAPPLSAHSDRASGIEEEHSRAAVAFDVGIATVKSAIVSGKSVVRDETGPLLLGRLMPGYVDTYVSGSLISLDHDLEGKTARHIIGRAAIVSHFNVGVYGHWLLEAVPKLLLLATHRKDLGAFRIVMHSGAPRYVQDWINLVLPEVEIALYDPRTEFVVCDELLLPSSLVTRGYFFHPIANLLFGDLIKKFSSPSEPMHLYITRERQSGFREMSNRAEIEGIAANYGLDLISPEKMSLADQICTFSNASLIVGEFGSAMHNSIFSKSGTQVFCLNWIVNVQSRIAQLRQQEVSYQLPSDGKSVQYEHGNTEKRFYHIDPNRFQRSLQQLMLPLTPMKRLSGTF